MRNVTIVDRDGQQVTHGKVLEIGLEDQEFTLRTPSKIIRYPKVAVRRIIDEPADQMYEDIETRLDEINVRLDDVLHRMHQLETRKTSIFHR